MTPRAKQLQFQRLVKHFVHRFVDNELIASGGEPHQIFVTAMALTGALGFTLGMVLGLRYLLWISDLKPALQQQAMLSDRQLMVLMTMIVTGLFTVLGWDSLWPDFKDAVTLGVLPVHPRQILGAKVYAAVLFFLILQVALNALPGLVLPGNAAAGGLGSLVRELAAQMAVLLSAAAFVFFGSIAAQGLLLLTLPYGAYLRASSLLQLLVLLLSLSMYSLTPDTAVSMQGRAAWTAWLPPVWFTNAWQAASGSPLLIPGVPPERAWIAAAAAVLGALVLLRLGFRHALRKAVEGQNLDRSGPGWVARLTENLLTRTILRDARERAVFLFTGRTLLRHRATRLMIAVYAGLGIAWTLTGFSTVLQPKRPSDFNMDSLYCGVPIDMLFLLLVGMRAMFAVPVELSANWLFRISEKVPAEIYRGGVRKLMLVFGCVPLALLPVLAGSLLWGPARALRLGLIVFLAGWLLTEVLLRNFHKLPFTCSWIPGQGNLKVKFGAYLFLFMALSWVASHWAADASQTPKGTLILVMWIAVPLAWRVYRRHTGIPWACVWEEEPMKTIAPLTLSR